MAAKIYVLAVLALDADDLDPDPPPGRVIDLERVDEERADLWALLSPDFVLEDEELAA